MADATAREMLRPAATMRPDLRDWLWRGPSAQDVLDRNQGGFPGFDTFRLALALSVVLIHSSFLSYGVAGSRTIHSAPLVGFMLALLPWFFALSGFLVAGSALRLRNTGTFLLFRGLRIAPALAVEVAMSALILGPLFTSLPLAEYFSQPDFFAYFGNIIGRVRLTLPGVFVGLPIDSVVNGNLWTLRPEFQCYAIMALLMLTRIVYSRSLTTLLWLTVSAALIIYNQATDNLASEGVFGPALLVYCFATGVVAFHWRAHIRLNAMLALICALIGYPLLLVPKDALFSIPLLTYLMVWIGAQKLPRINGDYSYGVYLFSYPVQQTLVGSFPSMREWWLLFPAAATIAILIAALSWHLIEKPALRLKKPILAFTHFCKAQYGRLLFGRAQRLDTPGIQPGAKVSDVTTAGRQSAPGSNDPLGIAETAFTSKLAARCRPPARPEAFGKTAPIIASQPPAPGRSQVRDEHIATP
jgi:peptidoglycan/LPS O-acetylase OafA/YrhL